MKFDNRWLYFIAGSLVIIGGKLMILADIWFPHADKMSPAEKWAAVGETVFAIGVFALVVALVYRVFIDKNKD
jgi:hypothetical protein